ncbi:NAD(P)H-dependent flavin oxidoreductase [Clostridium saccharoperbutylacetonicum]|jgi:NAD(P)H-dependent flavin oxidoreductase YrpB (nitropropane dioxygenase family)|uniref:Probable nitronate monooxygenase n=1 Tax=Clostridium saccharoperbutylacetonicum N1-4(HMT) TaxID=931276 RepID=M1MHX7_9CLOT|nr:nitronate monooxygenase family protein [Clostridium saccharoperbutylacetonicum]AGF54511.1 2-nitropropane dioxygenase [Clostridium saccharoperbutylacetonicum N1-4(HMT)]AQR93474.1 isopentenyl-diphosphate delta-isomerase [Clostridium saccharoperbutylacetonicum]NRT58969.1 NAD(P)H-dependent flavin oxidoreductase YrpB (nitropropane dioxygenase family) [Clostridium saccharoperbutylacetonicum]NSB28157.1 NAD(P)H-dependent flavin oxidoreductase YrpB (nitropropane dioxygenase family) [Clostridium sacch
MNFNSLKIGNLVAPIPIIQGGMGVGVSASNLAAAVAKAGGIGIISAAQLGYKEDDFEKNTLEANLKALKKHIELAKSKAVNGIIGINAMVATNNYEEHIRAAIEAGVDLIISGAGLPTMLPKIVKGSSVKIAPIVSSLKAAKVILKLWDKHDNVAPDLVVIEGPKAGGHLGFKVEELENDSVDFDQSVVDIISETKKYAEKYNKEIPVVVAGGVFDGYDIAKYLKLGANGVQMATRFVATEECDASDEFKNAYINCSKEDIQIVKSPVGMPGRAISNPFVKKVHATGEKVTRCYNCLTPCNPATTPYCISKALINAVNGNIDEGLIFCGENASKITKITTVQELMDELVSELKNA